MWKEMVFLTEVQKGCINNLQRHSHIKCPCKLIAESGFLVSRNGSTWPIFIWETILPSLSLKVVTIPKYMYKEKCNKRATWG